MMNDKTMKHIQTDVMTGVSAKDSTLQYGKEELAHRDAVAQTLATHPGVMSFPHEWPEFSDDDIAELKQARIDRETASHNA